MHNRLTKIAVAAVAIGIGTLSAACGQGSPMTPSGVEAPSAASTDVAADADGPSCALALHAILRETDTQEVAGSMQIRITPGASADEPVLSYAVVFGPTGDLEYSELRASIRSAIPDQSPTWTDVPKSDPGTTLTEVLRFGRATVASPELVAALVDDPSRYKAVVQVVGTTGGREAEGLVAPETREPEPLRDRYRACFGVG